MRLTSSNSCGRAVLAVLALAAAASGAAAARLAEHVVLVSVDGLVPEYCTDMHTGLILSGAGVRCDGSRPLVAMVDIAPTVARLLGLSMPGVEGEAREELLLESGSPAALSPTPEGCENR